MKHRISNHPTQTLKEIDLEIAKLRERAASIVAKEKAGVVERIKEAISYYGLMATDLGLDTARGSIRPKRAQDKPTRATKPALSITAPETAAPPTAKKPRAGAGVVKYKDDAGNAWSGFGPKPRWLTDAIASGKALEDLKV
jgi:DNA-binding protein H-NS